MIIHVQVRSDTTKLVQNFHPLPLPDFIKFESRAQNLYYNSALSLTQLLIGNCYLEVHYKKFVELDRAPGESDYLPNTRKFVQFETDEALEPETNLNQKLYNMGPECDVFTY
jgi:hypothetical protein